MDPQGAQFAAARARILLLALLGCALWVVLTLFASPAPASATDESGDSLLGTVVGIVDVAAESPVAAPVSAAAGEVVAPAHAAARQTAPTAITAIGDTITTSSAIVTNSVEPVLEHSLAALGQSTQAATRAGALLPDTDAVGHPENDPVLQRDVATVVGPRTDVASTAPSRAESNEPSAPAAPGAPPTPSQTDSTAPAQSTAQHAPAAAILGTSATMTIPTSSRSAEDDTLPSSTTFDTDYSPD